ncbi:MAG: response regulator transcription factor [Taibaiella sp.]|jgi:DNA-binding NarL/FixJ family response regulator
MPVKLIIYEDHDSLRESLVCLLGLVKDYEVLASFSNYKGVAKQIADIKPDIVLMDIDMPEISGIEAVKTIRSFNTQVQIIMLTVFDDNQHVFDALSAGANGYLLKANISDRLVTAIQEVLQGGAPMSPSIARMLIDSYKKVTKTDYNLTQREREILQSLADGNSYKLIADMHFISIDTVRTHIKHIYDKLHVRSQTEALSKVFKEKLL